MNEIWVQLFNVLSVLKEVEKTLLYELLFPLPLIVAHSFKHIICKQNTLC